MKYLKFRVISLLFISVNAFCQDFEKIQYPLTIEGQILSSPFTGGMNNPQFSSADMDQDGILDLVIFDRAGNTWTTYKGILEGNEIKYIYSSGLESILPRTEFFSLLVDFDNDGIEDIFSGSSVPGIPGMQVYKGSLKDNILSYSLIVSNKGQFPIIYYENNSGSFNNLYVSTIDLPAILDVDGDEDIDILTFDPAGSTVYYYKNLSVEKGWNLDSLEFFFTDQCWGKFVESGLNSTIKLSESGTSCASGFNGIKIRHAGATVSGFDLDVDEDIDLLIGDLASDNIAALFNGGSKSAAYVTAVDVTFPSGDIPVSITTFPGVFFLDINQDGKTDMIASPNEANIGENIEVAHLYKNVGGVDKNNFTLTNERFLSEQIFDAGFNSKATVFDVNGDGLKDILVGSSGRFVPFGGNDTRLILFENIGSVNSPAFELIDNDFLGMSAYSNTFQNLTPEAGDIDSDGDIDLIIGENLGKLIFFENIGEESESPQFSDPIFNYMNIDVGLFSSPIIYDLNQDGKNDLIIGERNGNLNFFKNISNNAGEALFESDLTDVNNNDFLGKIDVRKRGFTTGASSPQIITKGDSTFLIVGSQNSGIFTYLINLDISSPFELIQDELSLVHEGDNVRPTVADLNQDGQYELILGNKRGGLSIRRTPWRSITTVVENPASNQIRLFPNPSSTYIHWEFNSTFDKVEVYTVSGKMILIERNSSSLDIRNLDSGIYIIKLYGLSNEKVYTSKFIKL